MNHFVGSIYIDANATCSDNLDSSCSVTANGIVDGLTLGTYTIDYNATDAAGNTAITQTRTIHVITGDTPVITLSGSGTITHE